MTILYLDDCQVVTVDDLNIKFTVENPYFSKATSYTYEVTLPMAAPANRRLLGNIDRHETDKPPRIFRARLVVDGRTILIGEAHITNVTDKDVKVQLLGEAAAYNYGNKVKDLYIDELDMGQWEDYIPASSPLQSPDDPMSDILPNPDQQSNTLYGSRYPWVAYPVRNTRLDKVFNNVSYIRTASALSYNFGASWEDSGTPNVAIECRRIAYQPFLWWICERVAAATGYDLARTDNALYADSSLLRTIFVANANARQHIAEVLPHWSVGEFWTYIEQTFNLILQVDYTSGKMRLIPRDEYYSDEVDTVYLHNVVDELTAEVDDDTREDVTTSNVAFADHDAAPEDILSKAILDSAVFVDTHHHAQTLQMWGRSQGAATLVRDYKNHIWRCDADGRWYIFAADCGNGSPGFLEVHMLRPRIVNEDKDAAEVSLKIVPARIAPYEGKVIVNRSAGIGTIYATYPTYIMEVPGMDDDISGSRDGSIDIERVLSGKQEATTKTNDGKPSVMYVAMTAATDIWPLTDTTSVLAGDGTTQQIEVAHIYPVIRERAYAPLNGAIGATDAPRSFSINRVPSQVNIYSRTLNNNFKISTETRYCFKFLSDTIPTPGNIFIIRGRRFVCEKLEATLKDTGLDKLIIGYFYPLQL